MNVWHGLLLGGVCGLALWLLFALAVVMLV